MISVMDNGIGIEEQHLSAIFDEYYQITPNRELGMGLGLNIVKQLAELLHVELTVTSKVGQGTCFQLLIPTDDTA
jgi:signal transduction histidine kinase